MVLVCHICGTKTTVPASFSQPETCQRAAKALKTRFKTNMSMVVYEGNGRILSSSTPPQCSMHTPRRIDGLSLPYLWGTETTFQRCANVQLFDVYLFHFDVWFELMYAVFVHQYIAILMYKRRKNDA